MDAQVRLDWINERIAEDCTVMISTHLRHTQIDADVIAKFEAAGTPFLKVHNNHLMMWQGKRYVIADGCQIKAYS